MREIKSSNEVSNRRNDKVKVGEEKNGKEQKEEEMRGGKSSCQIMSRRHLLKKEEPVQTKREKRRRGIKRDAEGRKKVEELKLEEKECNKIMKRGK